jgi:hypothetical protein
MTRSPDAMFTDAKRTVCIAARFAGRALVAIMAKCLGWTDGLQACRLWQVDRLTCETVVPARESIGADQHGEGCGNSIALN